MRVRPVLLDTRAIIWLMNGDRLTDASREAIAAARAADGVHVSPISAWEIGMLVARGRMALTLTPEAWFSTVLRQAGVELAPMPPEVLIASSTLPGQPPRDPADRIIAATARAYGHVLITRDGELVTYGEAGHLEVVVC